jgi:hypothetical protein
LLSHNVLIIAQSNSSGDETYKDGQRDMGWEVRIWHDTTKTGRFSEKCGKHHVLQKNKCNTTKNRRAPVKRGEKE